MTKPLRVAIIGAGIAGLSCGHFLKKRFQDDVDLTIFEKSASPGGWIKSIVHNGMVFECGPKSLRNDQENSTLLELIDDLNLRDKMLETELSSLDRYLIIDGALEKMPNSLFGLITTKVGRILLRGIFRDLFAPKGDLNDESIQSFSERRFGSTFEKYIIDPLISGIYGTLPSSLSMKKAFSTYFQDEKENRSCILAFLKRAFSRKKSKSLKNSTSKTVAPRTIISFDQGLSLLPKALAEKLSSSIKFSTTVHKLSFSENRATVFSDQGSFEYDYVICTLSPLDLAPLFSDHSIVQENLSTCSMTSLVGVSCVFTNSNSNVSCSSVAGQKKGFGILCPSSEDLHLLGVVFDHCLFSQRNSLPCYSVLMGGRGDDSLLEETDNELIQKAQLYLNKYLNINDHPIETYVYRAKNSIPCYSVGIESKIGAITAFSRTNPCLFGGSFFWNVSMIETISQAKAVIYSLAFAKKMPSP